MSKYTEAEIINNLCIVKDIYLISLRLPFLFQAKAGQFCILRLNKRFDPLLGRPFSIFDSNKNVVRFLYRVKGKGTAILSKMKKGEVLYFTGPLGRWYPYPENNFVVIAGGIGLASVYYLIKNFPKKAFLFYGVKTEKEILFYEKLKKMTKKVYISTENVKQDAIAEYTGVVTELFKDKGANLNLPVYACGPMIMLKELKKIIKETVPCYVAVEERMACGVGACLGCVIETSRGLKRICTDGPVFELRELKL
uniref:Dihydroorotate dehydrogenase electron transfer subunit n=1 Tax=Thermodesulfovibrio aggregans TaxID=86166 RepID=A0A7C4EPQ8_9BACT